MPGKTMMQTPTVESVYAVVKDGATVLETQDFAEALARRRACGGAIQARALDRSPS